MLFKNQVRQNLNADLLEFSPQILENQLQLVFGFFLFFDFGTSQCRKWQNFFCMNNVVCQQEIYNDEKYKKT